ncbi:SIMPL domain-containing protein [Undibacterium sp. Ji42W]|uniref:SIMPL domain-containing protein n=1 Tax=Undibacterium sp. Ji42W TaxID=3413039 RepID=UPI003BF13184
MISISAEAGTLPAYPFIHVNGSATITLPANIAEMDFELTSFEASADETLTLLNAQSSEVLEFLSAYQIIAADIEAHDTRKLVARTRCRQATSACNVIA